VKTEKGRVVYNRKVHLFRWKDVSRIEKALKELLTDENFFQEAINALIESANVIERDFVSAFEYSIKSFWEWAKNPKVEQKTFSESRSFATDLEELKEEIYSPGQSTWDKKEYGIRMTVIMINLIEEIQREVK